MRRRRELPARWRLPDRARSERGTIRDIGQGGVFLEIEPTAAESLRVGMSIGLHFAVDGDCHPMRVAGEIRWIGHHDWHGCVGVGIEFERIRPELRVDDPKLSR